MLKTARKMLLAAALAAACGGVSAVQIKDTVDPSPNLTITKDTPYVFTHDISEAFDVGFDTIVSAFLNVYLFDNQDQGKNKGKETFSFTIGSGDTSQTFSDKNVNNGNKGAWYVIPLNTALLDLVTDGQLSVTLAASEGSYGFSRSNLTAEITRGVAAAQPPASPASVPEPGSLLLVGAGLVGLVMTGRKKLQLLKRR